MDTFTEAALLQIRDRHESWLRSQPGVVGTGVGLSDAGDVVLKVYSDRMPPVVRDAILARLAGVPVVIEETGRPRLLNER
jgi:hypothetical protein